jgi:acetoin utilization protein AcuC
VGESGDGGPPPPRSSRTNRPEASTPGRAPLVVWDPRFRRYDFGPDHPFSEASRDLAVRLLERSLLPPERPSFEWVRSIDPAAPSVLERFHAAAYVERVRRVGGGSETVFLDRGDTPGNPGCFEAAARIVGGAVRAAERVWEERRPAFHPAGGLHHARPDGASGFCIFNDLAVAIAGPLAAGRRIAYLDIDAHHGDGVMYGFYGSGRLLDIDFHQDGRTLFPGTGSPSEAGEGDGAGLKVNVPLPPGAGDVALLPLFRRIVPPLLDRFRPEMIVLQHGVDGHAGDPLAQLQYTAPAYAEIARTLCVYAADHCERRILITGGGGYRAESVARVLARTGRILAGISAPEPDAGLPDAWRTEFFEETGYAAPERWAEPEPVDPYRWSRSDEDALTAELERRTGLKFPPVVAA